MSTLKISNICKKFKSRILINNACYCFEPNKIYCITGANGTGKTTLFNIISNLTSFDGEVFIDNLKNCQTKDLLSKKICYIPQFSCLFERSTLKQNYELCQKISGHPIKFLYPQTKTVAKLSGGQKKMSNLARINDSYDIYLLDEPTAYLDQKNKAQLYDMILKLKEKNKIIIIISHEQEIIDLCDIIVKIEELESPKETSEQTSLTSNNLKAKDTENRKLAFQEFIGFIKENTYGNLLRGLFLIFFLVSLFVLTTFSLKTSSKEAQYYVQQYYSSINLTKKEDSKTSLMEDYDSGVLRGGYLSKITHSSSIFYDSKIDYVKTILFDKLETGVSISDYYAYKLFGTTNEETIIGQTVLLKHYSNYDLSITRVIKTNYLDYADETSSFYETILDACKFVIISDQYLETNTVTSYTLLNGNYYFPTEYSLITNDIPSWITNSFWNLEAYQVFLMVIMAVSFLALCVLLAERKKMDNRKRRVYKLKVLGCNKTFIEKLEFYETLCIHLMAIIISSITSYFIFNYILQRVVYEELLANNIFIFQYSYWLIALIIMLILIADLLTHLIERKIKKI